MKKLIATISIATVLSACTSLTHQEQNTLRSLKANGISVEKPAGVWDRPASPVAAGALNILPGFGNFYLAAGNINERELIYFYTFDESGKEALSERNLQLTPTGKLEKIKQNRL